jgi:hypothetical protein
MLLHSIENYPPSSFIHFFHLTTWNKHDLCDLDLHGSNVKRRPKYLACMTLYSYWFLVGFGFLFLYEVFNTAAALVSDLSVTSVTLTIRLTSQEEFFLIDNAILVLLAKYHVNRANSFLAMILLQSRPREQAKFPCDKLMNSKSFEVSSSVWISSLLSKKIWLTFQDMHSIKNVYL